MQTTPRTGTLHVVATPIGNLGDLSPRALDTLRAVAAICAEDTRHTRQLLAHYGLERPLVALHEHNEEQLADKLVARLQAGESLALVSLCSCNATSGRSSPKWASNCRVWRVSSAQIAETLRSVSSARGERSARLPIGVATT